MSLCVNFAEWARKLGLGVRTSERWGRIPNLGNVTILGQLYFEITFAQNIIFKALLSSALCGFEIAYYSRV